MSAGGGGQTRAGNIPEGGAGFKTRKHIYIQQTDIVELNQAHGIIIMLNFQNIIRKNCSQRGQVLVKIFISVPPCPPAAPSLVFCQK